MTLDTVKTALEWAKKIAALFKQTTAQAVANPETPKKIYHWYWIGLAALASATLAAMATALFICKLYGDADKSQTKEKIAEIKASAEIHARRTDAILDAARHREETARNETAEQMAAVPDDDLPDLLAGLLEDYRKQHPDR